VVLEEGKKRRRLSIIDAVWGLKLFKALVQEEEN